MDKRNVFIYMSGLVHRGEYNSEVTWADLLESFRVLTGEDGTEERKTLISEGLIDDSSVNDAFVYFPESVVELSDEDMNIIMEHLSKENLCFNIALLARLEPALIEMILSNKLYYGGEKPNWKLGERAIISMILNKEFLSDKRVKEYLSGSIKKVGNIDGFSAFEREPWFLELLLIIKRGLYGNGGFSYISSLSDYTRISLVDGSYTFIGDGKLLYLLLNYRKIISKNHFTSKLNKFEMEKARKEKVSSYYGYLSIANDVLVGIEFLVGSIEFLPKGNEVFGVYLFIAGSAELLIRPLIEIARRLHVRALERKHIA
jgi:hypothetical protein